jgi:hypothetical protein
MFDGIHQPEDFVCTFKRLYKFDLPFLCISEVGADL